MEEFNVENLKSFLESLTLPLLLGSFGGVARSCRTGFGSRRQFFSSIMVSSFTGVVVHLALQDSSLSGHMQAALIAASGYSGGSVIDALVERLSSKISGKIQEKE
jgi:hypothetical protein